MNNRTGSIFDSKKWILSISLFLLLLPVFLSIVPFFSGWGSEIQQSGDNALLEMATGEVSFGVFTGAYSRFGFHHPGPMYFYMRYPLYAFSGGNASSFYISTALILAFSLWLSSRIIWKNSFSVDSTIFAFICSLFMLTLTRTIWLSQWNPFVIIFPLFLLIVSVAAYSSRAKNSIFIAVVSGSFLAQTHLGMVPVVGIVFLYMIIMIFIQRSYQIKGILISFLLLFLLWVPVIVDQLSPHGSQNISIISEVLGKFPPIGISRLSIVSWLSTVVSIEMFFLGPWIKAHFQSPVIFHVSFVFLRSLLLFYAWFQARKQKNWSFEVRLCELTVLLTFISLISVFNIRGDIYQYLTLWFSVVSALSWFSILIVVYRLKFLYRKKTVQIVFLCLLVITAFLNVKEIFTGGFSKDPLQMHDTVVEFLSQEFVTENVSLHSNEILIEIRDDVLWPEMVGLACNLGKQGFDVTIQENYSYMLNRPNVLVGHPQIIILYFDENRTVNIEVN